MQFRSRDLSSEQDFVYEQKSPASRVFSMEAVGILNASTKNALMIRKRTNATEGGLDPVPYRTEQSRTHSAPHGTMGLEPWPIARNRLGLFAHAFTPQISRL